MNDTKKRHSASWLRGFATALALIVTTAIFTGCHDDSIILYRFPDLVDEDRDLHYLSTLTVAVGDELTIGLDVQSLYNSSDSFVTRFYLSFNDTITDNDLLLGTYYSGGLNEDERERQWVTLIFPNMPAGRYFVGCIIDERNEVNESNERNNFVLFQELIDVIDLVPVATETKPEKAVGETPTANFPPIAICAESDVFGRLGHPITLSASGSSDPEGEALTYAWIVTSLPAGADADAFANVSGDNMITQFTPTKVGNYTFMATVSDGENDATDSVTIIVE